MNGICKYCGSENIVKTEHRDELQKWRYEGCGKFQEVEDLTPLHIALT